MTDRIKLRLMLGETQDPNDPVCLRCGGLRGYPLSMDGCGCPPVDKDRLTPEREAGIKEAGQ